MDWIICMCAGYAVLVILIALALISFFTKNRIDNLSRIAFAGVFIADVIMFFPCYIGMFDGFVLSAVKAVMASIHHTIRLFVVDGELTFVFDCVTQAAPPEIRSPYIALASLLFICSPIFTFGFILSFFKSVSSQNHFIMGYYKDKYFFSEVNDSTLALAEDIRSRHPKALIVFADSDEKRINTEYDYAERLAEIRAICFQKDIAGINVAFGSRQAQSRIFLLSLDENANHKQAVILRNKYGDMNNLWLYVHSVLTDSELMLAQSVDGKKQTDMRIRRMDDVRLLINHILYHDGHKIFDTAVQPEDGGEKIISALIVGMGNHGTELIRALPYFCQMDGYRPYLYATDINDDEEAKFRAMCPELMDDAHNGDFETPGEAHCKISFFPPTDVLSMDFIDRLNKLPVITYVFISLGNDSLNISTAKTVRMVCERRGLHPMIQAVVYDSDKTEVLQYNNSGGKDRYDIDFVGDIKRFYTEDVIIASELERKALERHLKWGTEEEFWNSEYNYKSSVASAIHRRMKQYCGIPQIELPPEKREEPYKTNIRILEHRRWNAYMRSEGYVYGKNKNHLIKTHHDLVPYYELPEKTREHDDD